MKQEYKEKKQILQSFAAVLVTLLIIGLNSFPVFAEESQIIETTVENVQQDSDNIEETYDDKAENIVEAVVDIDNIPNVENVDEDEEVIVGTEPDSNNVLNDENVNENEEIIIETEPNSDIILDDGNVNESEEIVVETESNSGIILEENEEVMIETELDSSTILDEEVVDETIAEYVITICTMIDSLPTVEMLYENAPGQAEESYAAWLLETENILKAAEIIQEQLNTLSAEEQAIVGEDRKIKLDELCGLSAVWSEKEEVYAADSPFTDENGVCYRVIQDGSDSHVEVILGGDYILVLNESLDIPKEVSHNDKVYSVTKIGGLAFSKCSNLTSVTIPDSVTEIGEFAFSNCSNLSSVVIPAHVRIGRQAFENCSALYTLKIIVNSESIANIVTVDNSNDSDAFENCPEERNLVFVLEDGTELTNFTTPTLKMVLDAYKAVEDGNTEDNLWYGWKLPDISFLVTIIVQKDNSLWENHDRVFGLKEDGSDLLITELTAVADGNYKLYDITVSEIDTGVMVSVNGQNIEAVVDYYTVTFYDGDVPYGDDTEQKPQIVLKNMKSVEPSAPEKEGYLFKQWVTAKEGNDPFDFDNTQITNQTNIYASWTQESIQGYIILSSSEGAGSIAPEGEIEVSAGESKTFTFSPNVGKNIISVIIDGQEIPFDEQTYTYTFADINDNHTIKVIFEEDDNSEDPDPDEGEEKPGDVEDDPGNGDDPGSEEKPGDVGDNPGSEEKPGDVGDDPGSGDKPGNGDNLGSGDKPGNGDAPGSGDKPGNGDAPGSGDKPEDSKKPSHSGSNNKAENDSNENSNSNSNQSYTNTVNNNVSPIATDNIENALIASNTNIAAIETEEYINSNSPKDNEPKTGDSFPIETYFMIAMATGFALLLLSFTDLKRLLTSNHKIKKHM